jgi:hypothetical protein
VHAWRVTQLARLGLARPVAEAVADKVDWHEVAKLVQRGCPAQLAVMIIQQRLLLLPDIRPLGLQVAVVIMA